jgi:hypothetical protein
VITPGSTAGEALHLLSSLERRNPLWDSDVESARATLSAAISLVMRLIGRDPDPAKSREHVLLSVLAERRLRAGDTAELGALLQEVIEPPIAEIGALPIDEFIGKGDRKALAAGLNTLLGSPTFAAWRLGATLHIGEWLTPKDGRTPAVILSVAHLDDDERMLVLGVIFEELLSWMRTLNGSQRLRAMVIFDEVYGFIPPHPAKPAHQAPAGVPDEASPRLRRRHGARHPESHGSGLPVIGQRRPLVHLALADRRRSRADGRRPEHRRRSRQRPQDRPASKAPEAPQLPRPQRAHRRADGSASALRDDDDAGPDDEERVDGSAEGEEVRGPRER